MEQVGYSLIDAQGNELQAFGDISGQMQGAPDVVRLPNGDDVHCPEVGADYEGVRLVERWLQYGDTQGIVFDGSKVVVTRPAPGASAVPPGAASGAPQPLAPQAPVAAQPSGETWERGPDGVLRRVQ